MLPAGVIAAFESYNPCPVVARSVLLVVPVPAVPPPLAGSAIITVQQLFAIVVRVVVLVVIDVPLSVVEASGTPDCNVPVYTIASD